MQLVTGPSSIGGDVFTVNLDLSVPVRWVESGGRGRGKGRGRGRGRGRGSGRGGGNNVTVGSTAEDSTAGPATEDLAAAAIAAVEAKIQLQQAARVAARTGNQPPL